MHICEMCEDKPAMHGLFTCEDCQSMVRPPMEFIIPLPGSDDKRELNHVDMLTDYFLNHVVEF